MKSPKGGVKQIEPEFAPPTVVRRMLDLARRDASNPLLGSESGGFG